MLDQTIESPEANPGDTRRTRRRVGFAACIGTTIEFYDFYIFGIASALVFGKLFFPELSPVAGTIAAFTTFAVGFVSRPLGAAIFGHFGDRIGRKQMLVITLLTMGVSTVLIGLLPTHGSIGIAAPILLASLRFIQGLGLGGEWGGAALLATEYAPKGKRGLYGSFVQVGSAPGFLLSNGIFLFLSFALSEEAFLSWGWRVPFILSAVLVAVGLYIRLKIAETPVFQKVIDRDERSRVPMLDVLRQQPLQVVLGGSATAITYVLFFTAGTYGLAYGVNELGLTRTTMLGLTMVAVVAMAVSTVGFAIYSDRVGRPRVMIGSAMAAMVWAFMFFPLLNTKNLVVIALAMSITLAIMGGIYGPMGAFLPELFKSTHRFTGGALAYSLGGIFGGALAPIIAASLNDRYGSQSIGYYLAAMALLSIVSVSILSRSATDHFAEVDS